MSLTVQQLQTATPPEVRERSRRCTVRRRGDLLSKKDPKMGPVLIEQYRVQGITSVYRVDLKFGAANRTKPPQKILQSPLWVSCTCDFFCFRCEFALTRKGSSSIIHSNGKPPRVTNPKLRTYLCKHAFRALQASMTTYLKK